MCRELSPPWLRETRRFVITPASGRCSSAVIGRATRTIRCRGFLDDPIDVVFIEWLDSDDPVHRFDIAIVATDPTRYRAISKDRAGGIDITVPAWLIGLSFISVSLHGDRTIAICPGEKARASATSYELFANFSSLFFSSFFFFIQNTPAIRINCHWFVQTVFFPPYRRLNRGGKDNFASFECRVIKNNWHGKCDDIAPGSRILNASGIVGPCSIFYVVIL